ncbi:hypothetical protein CCAX7_40800 [Capsulimonas corticalis]|uniref:Rhamnogalacturonase A/B/Epimerase-like pectate lyase domain-containing protein n=1 Tax=Capsulimonas corticalis TaxID=2219043 RepID=A0A402D6C3_9BACT|nr:glycosyl hydrolase family 28-related protein [Capsulimonas corticalis]BDI32029.1 hypothetical protein CCAX7_40800 [Capsulimonas corticalis]
MNLAKIRAVSICLSISFGLLATPPAVMAQAPPGVHGDGVTDDTAALQAALDEAGKSGSDVTLGTGRYLIKGALTVPPGVSLRGTWESPHHGAWEHGTTFLLTGGRGQENGPAAITLQQSSSLLGVTMVWPEETADNIVPYPWAVHGYGMHNTVENVTLVNAYQGIKIGQPSSELHLIRNVFGCVLRRGIFIDSTTDIGRIENVHFNTHYWMRSGYPSIQLAKGDTGRYVTGFTEKNLEAFIFGRSDWEYVLNTFVWGAHIGYRFIKTPEGACNGQFMGIGADACAVGVLVDYLQGIGIQVTNGEFTAFVGEPNAGIVISPTAVGAAQFVNCNFWTTPGGAIQVHGNAQVTVNACHFAEGAKDGVIQADKGHLIVSSNSFAATGKAVTLKPGVRSAIVTSNLQPGGLVVDNKIGAFAQIALNEIAYKFPASLTAHYLVNIGASGDEEFLRDGWGGSEDVGSDPPSVQSRFHAARWTTGDATLRLPVKSGAAYTLTVWLLTRDKTPQQTVSVAGRKAPATIGKNEQITLQIPASATQGRDSIDVKISGQAWSPSKVIPGSGDARLLGARVFGVEMKSAGGPAQAKIVN